MFLVETVRFIPAEPPAAASSFIAACLVSSANRKQFTCSELQTRPCWNISSRLSDGIALMFYLQCDCHLQATAEQNKIDVFC